MLVEDHTDTRQMYVEFLRAHYEVTEACDGIAALESVRAHLPDVIVTDLALPRMDGFELVARIRAEERTAKLPVIALSGYSGPEHQARVQAAGTTLVLLKPCMPDALLEALKQVLVERPPTSSSSSSS
ncbi:MAG: response regulator [Vicinamibacterales bacterium]